jgi:hypothetical protein
MSGAASVAPEICSPEAAVSLNDRVTGPRLISHDSWGHPEASLDSSPCIPTVASNINEHVICSRRSVQAC